MPCDAPCHAPWRAQADLSALALKSHIGRAARVLADAKTLGVPFEIAPADVAAPRARLLYGFVGALMGTRLGLPTAGANFSLSELNLALGAATDEREQLAFRNWITSLGLGRPLTSDWLAEDCRDGILLLRIEERLRPGIVNWARVSRKPRSIYQRIENCNYALEVARKLQLRTVGIDGPDIADGNPKLTLAVIWQLMRASVLAFLSELGMDEQDIRAWANLRVRDNAAVAEAGGSAATQIGSFRDPALQTGVFLLRLLQAVAPECVEAEEIESGATAQECALNARYAISCAHKMGCTVFISTYDIVEVQPNQMLCLMAAVMAVDMRRNDMSRQQLLEQLHGDHAAGAANVLSF